MRYKQEIQYITDDRVMTIEDQRTEEVIEVSLKAFKIVPSSSQFKERYLVADRYGYKISIPIILTPSMAGYIDSATINLEKAIHLLNTKSELRSEGDKPVV